MGLLRNSKTPISRENESGTLDEILSLFAIEQTQSGYTCSTLLTRESFATVP